MKRLGLPAAVAGLILLTVYGAITFYDYHLKFGRMWETPAIRPHEAPLLQMAAGLVPFDGGETLLRLKDEADLEAPFALSDPTAVQTGKQHYFTYCAPCHGKYHDGNGTVGQSFAPLPTDLRLERVQALPQGRLFKEMSYGIPGGRQPPLATTIAPGDRWQIIAYVKSLGPREP